MVTEVRHTAYLSLAVIDVIANLANPQSSGASAGRPRAGDTGWSAIYLPDGASASEIGVIEAAFAAFDSLTPLASLTVIPGDDATETIITLAIADSDMKWVIVDSLGDVVGEGDEATVAGVLTLEFATNVPDVYDIYLIRKTGDFACGHVTITVTEV